jgi:uncharacterized protein (TIGR03435 family)
MRYVLLMLMISGGALSAQQPAPAFDVVSVKPNHSNQPGVAFRATPTGRIEFTNVTVGSIITASYQRFPFDSVEVVGAQDWVGREHYDVIGQTAPGTGAPGLTSEILAMLRTMLADRFSLVTHWEKRDRDVYALVRARPDGRLGPGLKPTDAGCGEGIGALTGGGRGSIRPGRGPSCTMGGGPGNLLGNALTVEMFGRAIGGELHRRVIDRTGITGNFDIDLHYRAELGGGRPGGPPPAPPDPDAPSIFTAVEEQLGLKLVSDRVPVDVLVIDRIERPAAD